MTFSCIIFENEFIILSLDGKIVERTRENPNFCHSFPLTVVVLLDGICHISGCVGGRRGGTGGVCGGCWWHWLVVFVVAVGGVCNVFFKIYAYINCNVIFLFLLFVGKTCLKGFRRSSQTISVREK